MQRFLSPLSDVFCRPLLITCFAVYLIKESMESMNTQPASTIYLVDYLANHHNYIEEVTQLKM
jgi:hypothetical protein